MNPAAFKHFLRARQLLSLGRANDAAKEYRQAISCDLFDASLRRHLAYALFDARRYDEANAEVDEAMRLAPNDAQNHFARALVLWQCDENKASLAAIEQAAALEPEDADTHGLHSTILGHFNRWPEAETAARRALEIDPQHSGATAALAAAMRAMGRGDEATTVLKAQLSHDAQDEIAHCRLGWHAIRDGQRPAAISHFLEALRIDPNYADARYGLAISLRARSLIYSSLFRFQAWLSDKQAAVIWTVMIAVFVVPRLLRPLAPGNAWFQMAIAAFLFGVFVFFMLWMLMPVLGLLIIRFDRDARPAMTADERRCARWHMLVMGATLLALIASPWLGRTFTFAAVVYGSSTALAVHHFFAARDPRERRIHRAIVGAVLLLCLTVLSVIVAPLFIFVVNPIMVLRYIFFVMSYDHLMMVTALLLASFGDGLARWLAGVRQEEPSL